MSIRIPLTRGLEVIIDAMDLPLVERWKWSLQGHQYAGRNDRGRIVYMHRQILGVLPGVEIDHVNGNGLDNRRANLRLATHSQNLANIRSLVAHNTSGFKGVSWDGDQRRRRKRWIAQIQVKGRHFMLGRFLEARQAAQAYDEAAKKHFGSFARTNKMMGLL